MLFNNGNGRFPQFSEVFILNPPTTTAGFYLLESDNTFGPENPDYIYADMSAIPSPFSSNILSGADRLPNGNILICEGNTGEIFEIDSQENIVWKYINPVHGGTGVRAVQGGNPPDVRSLFRATKYGADYPAFIGKDLTPGSPVELNSQANVACSVLDVNQYIISDLDVSPNPTSGIVTISLDAAIDKIEVYSILGTKMRTLSKSKTIDLSEFQNGIYLLKIFAENTILTKKIIKQ